MLEPNSYSNKIFTPIQFDFSLIDLLKSIKMGIKFKYVFSYIPPLFILFIVFNFFAFINSDYEIHFYYKVLFVMFAIITLNLVDAFNTVTALEEIKGNFNFKIIDSYNFIINNISSLLLPNFFLIFIIGFFISFLSILILLSNINYIGSLLFSLSYIFLFILGLLIILAIVALVISINFSPIIFTIYGGDLFTTVLQCFSLAWSKIFHIILYTIFNLFISLFSTLLVISIFYFNYLLINITTNQNIKGIWENVNSIILNKNTHYIGFIDLLSSYILSFVTIIIILFIISIFLSIFNINKIITYINIIKKIPDHKII